MLVSVRDPGSIVTNGGNSRAAIISVVKCGEQLAVHVVNTI